MSYRTGWNWWEPHWGALGPFAMDSEYAEPLVAAFLPDMYVHVQQQLTKTWIVRVEPCPKEGGCSNSSCYRAGEWLATFDQGTSRSR